MRKSKKKRQRKSEAGLQLKLFSGQAGELAGTPTGGTGTGLLSRVALLSLLERQRTLTTNLMERIVDYGNLSRACKQVVSNKGSSGIDGMETQELRPWLGKHLTTLQESLLTEEYEVSPVLKVEIDKPDGGKRMLGIPTVIDRLIQQAIQQELSHYYDPIFSESSYGFRPGRSAHQAIRQASKYVREGKEWVVDIDLEKFFD
jgi:retron-type reverse transcriptase